MSGEITGLFALVGLVVVIVIVVVTIHFLMGGNGSKSLDKYGKLNVFSIPVKRDETKSEIIYSSTGELGKISDTGEIPCAAYKQLTAYKFDPETNKSGVEFTCAADGSSSNEWKTAEFTSEGKISVDCNNKLLQDLHYADGKYKYRCGNTELTDVSLNDLPEKVFVDNPSLSEHVITCPDDTLLSGFEINVENDISSGNFNCGKIELRKKYF